MKDFFKTSSFRVLIIAVVVLLGLIIYTATAGGSFLANLLGFATSPMQSIATDVTGNVTEFLDLDGYTKDELKDLVGALQEENAQLEDQLVGYEELQQENEQLKTQLGLEEEEPENELRSASVIGRDPNDVFYGFSIDAGTLSGVSVGDPVITDQGLVEKFLIQSILQAGFSRILAEKILHLRDADPAAVLAQETIRDHQGRHPMDAPEEED